jgi:fibronectin-binding autotransporter adhesin
MAIVTTTTEMLMKTKFFWVVFGLYCGLLSLLPGVQAKTVYWQGAYPSATWDTTSTYWNTVDNTAPNTTFSTGDDVVFGKYNWYSTTSKSATVDLSGGSVAANSITFNIPSGTSGIQYTIQNGTINLSSSGTSLSKTGVRGDTDTISAAIVLGASTTWDVQVGLVKITGQVSGSGYNITKTGSGAIELSGSSSNTYGNLTIAAGTVSSAMTTGNYAFGGDLIIGDGSGAAASAGWYSTGTGGNGYQQLAGKNVTINSDGVFYLGTGGTNKIATLTLAGGYVVASSGTQYLNTTKIIVTADTTQSQSSVGAIYLGDSSGRTEIAINSAVTLTVGNVLATDSILKTGDGTLVLSAANTFNNTTISTLIRAGTVRVLTSSVDLSAGALGQNTTNTASRIVALGDSSSGTSAISLLNGASGITTQRQISVSSSGTGTVTIGGDHTSGVSTFSAYTGSSSVVLGRSANLQAATGGTVVFANSITGTGGVTKVGGGTVIYTASNTYSGTTDIKEGTLALSGSGTLGSSAVTLRSGATFDITSLSASTYTITQTFSGAGAVAATGKTLQLGSVVYVGGDSANGLLSVTGGLTLQVAAITYFELDGTGRGTSFDAIDVSGLLTLDGTIVVTGSGFTTGDSYQLLSWGSIDSSSFNLLTDLILPTLSNGLEWNTTNLLTTGTISVVPEPSTYALLVFSFLSLMWGRKLRRREV